MMPIHETRTPIPTQEYYSVTGNYRIRVWASFVEFPHAGEAEKAFLDRIQEEYAADHHQKRFGMKLLRHADGSAKCIVVELQMVDGAGK